MEQKTTCSVNQRKLTMTEDDIEIVEMWIDMWSEEIADDDVNDPEMYAEDKKVILATRRMIAYVKSKEVPND